MQGKNWELALQLRPWESCAYSRVLPLFKVYKLRVSTIYFPRWLLTFRMTWQPVSNHAMKLKSTTLVPLLLIPKNVQIDPQSCLSKSCGGKMRSGYKGREWPVLECRDLARNFPFQFLAGSWLLHTQPLGLMKSLVHPKLYVNLGPSPLLLEAKKRMNC